MRKALLTAAAAFGLLLAGCGGTIVGHSCTTNNDCGNGLTCDTSLSGGYCTKGCSLEGGQQDCPEGSICASQNGALLCANTCTGQGDCRSQYECNGVSNTDKKACRPK